MSQPYDQNLYRVHVLNHHDGDTSHIVCDVGFDLDIHLTVRWVGINAPERSTPEGKAALAWLNTIIPPGSDCFFRSAKSPKDKYGRYLATFLLADGTNVNDLAVASGHASAYDGHGPK